jgi:glutaredoxin-like protein NrdH
MGVTLYTKPGCSGCKATKRDFEKYGIEHSVVDVSEDVEAYERLVAKGVAQMPAVETDDDFWTGYNRDKIKALAGQ